MHPKVTVAIPSYNHGRYLGEAITSALEQTYPVDEVLVVENGSTDTSLAVARAIDHPRLRVHENLRTIGGTDNWNRCFELATGDYVVLLHADDVLAPTMVERLMERALRDPDIVMVNCDYDMHYIETGQVLRVGMWYHHGDSVRNQTFEGRPLIELMLRRGDNSLGTTSMQLLKVDAVRAVRGFDPNTMYVTDWEFSMRLLQRGKLGNVAEALVGYRMHADNGTTGDANWDHDIRGHVLFLERIMSPEKPYGDISPDAIESYRQNLARRLISRLQQLAPSGPMRRTIEINRYSNQTRGEILVSLARLPCFEGVISFGAPQTATAPA